MARVLITGGAGFIGSHLCERFLARGRRRHLHGQLPHRLARQHRAPASANQRFTFIQQDVTNYIYVKGPLDAILHFASPASPVDYLELPIQTLKVGSLGTHKALGLAKEKGARFLLASHLRGATATRSSIRRTRTTGATSTRSARAACTTRRSASPRR